jgi:cell division protein FtsB
MRHKTLVAENKKLEKRNTDLEEEAEQLKKRIEAYERKKRADTL